MGINATLLGQMIAFAIFVWFTMKFVWPVISAAMEERQKRISEGLAAAERGRKDLEDAESAKAELLKEARAKANEMLEQANRRANEIVEDSRETARLEGEKQFAQAKAQIEQELNRAKRELREQVVSLAITGATRVLEREVDGQAHNDLLNNLARQL